VLTNFRYSNQGLSIDSFDIMKTGNLISSLFFGVILLLILINMFSGSPARSAPYILLNLIALISIVFLIVSYYLSPKDEKVIYSSIFIVFNLFILLSLIDLAVSRSKRIPIIRSGFLCLVLFAVSMFIIFLQIYNFKDDSSVYLSGKVKADAGVVLGAAVWGGNRPSPVLRERINKGYEIYEKTVVPRLVLTGGGSPNEMTEADVARNELIKYGVKKENLIVENTSNSTIEQVLYVRDKLYKRLKWSRIILVSDNYHLYRAGEICSFNDMSCGAVASDTPLSMEGGIAFCVKESFAVLIYWFFGFG
jgi:uncharacterized SAM-binding protein YcdF (DUF218 family)